VTRVLACAGDAGGAEAVYASGPATAIFARAALQPVALALDIPHATWLSFDNHDVLLLGTGPRGPEHEAAATAVPA
jgi:hypothetical protein